jgi:hypothetical protein
VRRAGGDAEAHRHAGRPRLELARLPDDDAAAVSWLLGHCRVLGSLGRGGTGEVFRALQQAPFGRLEKVLRGSDPLRSSRLPTHGADCRQRHRPLDFGNPLQGRASQPLRIPSDVTLSLALEPRHPAIEGSDELEQVVKD